VPPPFPGMDPYLEHPTLWPGVHNGLIAALQLSLAPQLRPRYYVAIAERLYITEPDQRVFVGRPDLAVIGLPVAEKALTASASSVLTVQVPVPDEVRETYLEVRETRTDFVLTVLEILSPTNKRLGRGRRLYEDKRMEVLASRTHLVEIDLIRAG
jgi:Uma2 family endonuclease